MLIKDLVVESMIFELRIQVKEVLTEAINDYLSMQISKLKRGDDLSDEELSNLAAIIATMKVLSVPQYRQAITKNDIGMDPNSAKDLFDFLKNIPRDGKFSTLTTKVFTSLKAIAPSIFKQELEDISAMRGATKQDRDQIINKVSSIATKIDQTFNKIKVSVNSKEDNILNIK